MAFYTLRFPNYATAQAAAQQLGFWNTETDELNVQGSSTRPDGTIFGWMIDEIGQDPIVTQATYDEDGIEITPAVTLPGYYVNIVGELPPAALAYLAPGGYGCAGRLFAGSVAGAHKSP